MKAGATTTAIIPSYHPQPLGGEGPLPRPQNNDDLTNFIQPPFVRLSGPNEEAARTLEYGRAVKTQDEESSLAKKQQKVARILDEELTVKGKRPVSKKVSPPREQRESQAAKPNRRQTKTGRNEGILPKDQMTSKIAHPPLDPKLGHVRQVSSQQKVFYKRPSSAMPRMKPALSR